MRPTDSSSAASTALPPKRDFISACPEPVAVLSRGADKAPLPERLLPPEGERVILRYSYLLYGVRVACQIVTDSMGVLTFYAQGRLGCLPYSIQNREGRRAIQTVLAQTTDLPHCRFEASPDHRLKIFGRVAVDEPGSVRDIMVATTVFSLEAVPYLELLSTFTADWPCDR